jgi:hypothetical protein
MHPQAARIVASRYGSQTTLLWQLPEQHWLSFPQPAPFGRHAHVPLLQKPLQHW